VTAESAGRSLKRHVAANEAAQKTCKPAGTRHAYVTSTNPENDVTANRSKPSEGAKAAQGPSLLVLAQPSAETDDLLEPLVRRVDLCLLRVTSLNAAELALRDIAVSLVLICPETEMGAVTAILDKTDELRPGIPVLALRPRSGEHLPVWKGRTVGILRCPILPDVLSRTVDVALGLGVQPSLQSKSRC
jgi:hypothetical protein